MRFPAKSSRQDAKTQRYVEDYLEMPSRWNGVPRIQSLFLSFIAPVRLCACARRIQPAGLGHRRLPFVLLVFCLFAGCGPGDAPSQREASKSLVGVKLRLVVVDDPAIAAAVRGLKDEWNAQTGADVEVSETTKEQVADAGRLPGDAVIGPAYLLGPLAEAKRLAPVPQRIARDPKGPWSETFELLRNQEAAWGAEVYGVPLGDPVLCCYCRADLLEKLHRRPPRTWNEYDDLARLLREEGAKSTGPKYGTIEPLGPGWAGQVLLARAAAYAKQRDDYTTLFDEKTFEPAIASPPFVRALEELVAAAKHAPPEQLGFDPSATRAEFWKGSAAMAVSWPTAANSVAGAEGAKSLPVVFTELPGAAEVFHAATRSWEPRSADAGQRVPFLGVAGRMGMVRADAASTDAAFELLLWLTDPQWGNQVFASSPATTLFRRSQVASPKAWVENGVSATAARQYAELSVETFSRRQFLASLRLPGRAEYLAALDEAVQAAVRGRQQPAVALAAAAETWHKINQRLGIPAQRKAYMHSLGLQ
jgi:multiple sugar transport system substrate-binding protein